MNKNTRTDLAIESRVTSVKEGADDGIKTEERELFGFTLTKTEIYKGRGERESGRKAGIYLSLETGKLWLEGTEKRQNAVLAIKELLLELMPETDGGALVAALGNEEITADSIGPKVAQRLVITHHMKSLNPALYSALELGDLSAIVPRVLGQTGVESAVLVRAAADKIKPACIIAVDALAARSLSRLATTVQLTCTGIAPGSGVCNSREELSEKTLGCPVIALGVPMVVDASTMLWELGAVTEKGTEGFFVTPKESDVIIRVMAEVIASAINSAVHRNAENIEEYTPL